MKKALLIKSKDPYSYAVIPNLGLGYLAASLRRSGFDAVILDCNKDKIGMKEFKKLIQDMEFHLVGFQVYTNGISSTKEMVDVVKAEAGNAIIVAGGPHPSGDPEHILKAISSIDCAVIGEGESAIVELMKLSKSDFDNLDILSKIKNIAYRDKNNNVVFNRCISIENLDELFDPAWDLIDPSGYHLSPHGTFSRGDLVAPIITSRGCPYPCTFCAAHKIFARRIRRRSVKRVLDEIEYLYAKFGVTEFHIEDDNFTSEKKYVLDFARGIKERKLKIWWACPNGIRADKIDEEMITCMENSGCYSVALGIESGSDSVLRMMKKNITVKEIKEKVDLIKDKTNIDITGFFLIGYPGETIDDIKKSLAFSKKLKIDKASFSPVMPLPGSELYDEWKKKANANSIDWDKFLYYKIIPYVSEINEKILISFLRQAVIGFYLRPHIIFGLLREIKTFNQLKVILKRIKTVLLG